MILCLSFNRLLNKVLVPYVRITAPRSVPYLFLDSYPYSHKHNMSRYYLYVYIYIVGNIFSTKVDIPQDTQYPMVSLYKMYIIEMYTSCTCRR